MAPTTVTPAPATPALRTFHTHNCLICGQRFFSLEVASVAFTQHQQDHHDAFSNFDPWEL